MSEQKNQLLFDPPEVPHVMLDATFTDMLELHHAVTRNIATYAQRRDRSVRVIMTVVENQPGCVTDNDRTNNIVGQPYPQLPET